MNATTEPRGAARDPAQIEREAGEIRADMDRTLDALERKFSPGQLLDRSMGFIDEQPLVLGALAVAVGRHRRSAAGHAV